MEEGRFPWLGGQDALTKHLWDFRSITALEDPGTAPVFVILVGESGVWFAIGYLGHFYESIRTNKPMGRVPNINSLSYCYITFI